MPSPRNLVVVILDSLRYDVAAAAATPNLDRLGPLEQRWSYASWTAPSHYNLLMGLLPHDSPVGVYASDYYQRDYLKYAERLRVPDMEFKKLLPGLWLPSYLKDVLGYGTHARVSMPVLNPMTPVNRGFDSFRLMPKHNDMAAMLDDILILARTGRAREATRSIDATALVDVLVEEYRELGRPVDMAPSPRLTVDIQPNLMRRAIRNLIDNAVTYGGSAIVRVEERGDDAIISVRDRGAGLPADQLEAVVRPFHRVEKSRNRDTGGSGLGLAIARAVAESHAGSLRLENAANGGLIAILAIPRKSEGP